MQKSVNMQSIQWKLVLMFVLLILAVMLVFGMFLQERIAAFYHDSFRQTMTVSFSGEVMDRLEEAAKEEDPGAALGRVMSAYNARLGMNANREYFILLRRTGEVIGWSDEQEALEKTGNLLAAMAGKKGDDIRRDLPYLDYAVVVGGEYIVYIKDNKAEMVEILRAIYIIVFQALVIGVFISVVLGFFLSRTITRPISNLTRKASKLAQGRFDTRIDIRARDEIGNLASTFSHMTTMIKSSMEELAREKNKLETMFRFMADGVMAFDINQEVIHINPAAREMLGLSGEREIFFDSFFQELGVDISMGQMAYMDSRATLERSIDIGAKNLKGYFATFQSEGDRLSGMIVVLQDITEERRLENSRREFVANVSHELRTPLTTIKSYSETLLDSASEPEEERFLSVIIREVDRMTRIVKDLLVLSSLDNQKLSTDFVCFSLDELLRGVTGRMSVNAAARRHTLEYHPSTVIPTIYGDRDRLEQVVINIISNAVKYTPPGGRIEVYAGYLYNEAYIKIKDNGIGISQSDLPRIFERFYRVDKARSRESGGTGLGLAIAKNLVELHGGSIKIDSEIGAGTEVLIKLPVCAEAEGEALQDFEEEKGDSN